MLSTTSSAPRVVRDAGERGDVGDAEQRVGRRLDPDELGAAGPDRGPHGVDVGDRRRGRSPAPQRSSDLGEQPERAAVGVVGDDDVVARAAAPCAAACPRRPGPTAKASPRRPPSSAARHSCSASRVGLAVRRVLVARRAARRRRPARRWTSGRSAAPPRRWSGPAPGRRGSRGSRSRGPLARPEATGGAAPYGAETALDRAGWPEQPQAGCC